MSRKEVRYRIPAGNENNSGMPPAAATCSVEIGCTHNKAHRDVVRKYKLSEQEALYAIQVLKEEVVYLNRLFEKANVDFWADEHLMDVSFVMSQTDASQASLL